MGDEPTTMTIIILIDIIIYLPPSSTSWWADSIFSLSSDNIIIIINKIIRKPKATLKKLQKQIKQSAKQAEVMVLVCNLPWRVIPSSVVISRIGTTPC